MAKLQSKQKQGEIVTGDTENDIDHEAYNIGRYWHSEIHFRRNYKKVFFSRKIT